MLIAHNLEGYHKVSFWGRVVIAREARPMSYLSYDVFAINNTEYYSLFFRARVHSVFIKLTVFVKLIVKRLDGDAECICGLSLVAIKIIEGF